MFLHRFYFVIFCSVLLSISCKKNSSPGNNADSGTDSSKTAQLSEKISLHHGIRVAGTMPGPSGNGPRIDTASDTENIIVLAGRYAVIRPRILSGEIAGYLLRISGDSTAYFKIDFSAPALSGRKKAGIKPVDFGKSFTRHVFTSNKTMDDPDYNDSLIVIHLPEDMKPGMFCVEYMGYDPDNNYGNMITWCVNIEAPGGDSRLTGKWKLNRSMINDSIEGNSGWMDAYDPLGVSVKTFYCVDAQLGSYPQSPGDIPDSIVMNDYRLTKYDISLLDNGSFSYDYRFVERSLNMDSSTFGNLVYNMKEDAKSSDGGGWTYNSTAKKMVIIYYNDWPGTDILDFAEWHIVEIQGNRFVVYFPANQNNLFEESWEFIKTE